MSRHPSDPLVASLIRNARLAAATNQYPGRTRTVGVTGARQYSAGQLVLETARADVSVSGEVGQARREVLAAELERRRMVEAADAARREAELDRQQAERERDEALARTRRQGGPDPDFATLAIVAAASMTLAETDLLRVIDAAVENDPALSPTDAADIAGERLVGLTPDQLASELATAGARPEVVDGLLHTGVDSVPPAELIRQGLDSAPHVEPTPGPGGEVEQSPEIG